MSSFIEHIEIKNFKSIRHLEMDGFKKINLFIGKPNVGKSNILEALSVFTIPYLNYNSSKKLTDLIRLEESIQIFHEGAFHQESFVDVKFKDSKKRKSLIKFDKETGILKFSFRNPVGSDFPYEYSDFLFGGTNLKQVVHPGKPDKFKQIGSVFYDNGDLGRIKRYSFRVENKLLKGRLPFLIPPFGGNLINILELNPELKDVFSYWFKQYGLRLVLDKASSSLKILKDNGEDVFIVPYSLIADTLQRIIFYKTAVASNKDSILIFEEPEAHSFPPYIAEFTQEVIESESNQFFIATHSPIIVNDFLENSIDDLAIFMVDFKGEQTAVKTLSNEEVKEVYKYGVDLFFNGENYS